MSKKKRRAERKGEIGTCQQCRKRFLQPAVYRRKYCSLVCQTRYHQRWSTKKLKQRLKHKSLYKEKVNYLKVYERDKGICHLCDGRIDMSLPKSMKWGGTLDHIIPLSLGGEHSYQNVKLAHRSCNSRKGNRMLMKAA